MTRSATGFTPPPPKPTPLSLVAPGRAASAATGRIAEREADAHQRHDRRGAERHRLADDVLRVQRPLELAYRALDQGLASWILGSPIVPGNAVVATFESSDMIDPPRSGVVLVWE
jgi:hypothetical protein